MKLKTFARRAAAAGAVLAALMLAALPALAAPKVQVNTTNAVADHADILSDETEQYVNDVSIKLSDACGAQIGVYTLDELLGSTTMEGFAYDVFNAWGLGSDDLDNGVLLLLAPNEADGGDYYIMRGDGLESQLSFSTLGSLLDEYMEPYWVNGDYDTGTQKTVQALANRLCSIYGVTLNSSYTDTSAPDRGGPNVMGFVLLVVAVLLVIWLITYLMRPRGPRPPRGGGGGSSFGNNMFWYSMGRASRRPRRPPPPPPPRASCKTARRRLSASRRLYKNYTIFKQKVKPERGPTRCRNPKKDPTPISGQQVLFLKIHWNPTSPAGSKPA